jgi:CelD/BcsL family acetyltransferase involved in cellulose biosynthesis
MHPRLSSAEAIILRGHVMKVSIIDPTTDSRWDEFVAKQEHGTIFHTSSWARVIKEAYGYLPHYYILEDEAGQFREVIPLYLVRSRLTGNRLVCLPFSDYCYPLGDNAADISLLLNSVKKEVKAGLASYLEIRGWQNKVTPDQLDLVTRDYYLLYLLDLEQGIDVLKERLHHSVRRGIHQAEQRGVTARMTRTEADLYQFYKLNVTTRKKLGVLPQPHAFFKALIRHVISQGLGFTVLAEWKGKAIAGVLFLTYKDTIYYKFNASDKKHLQKRPNHLAIWEAIQYACANGYKHCDFGRCSPEEEGLRIFKSRWGTKEVSSPYYYYPKVKGFITVPESSPRYRVMKLLSHVIPKFAFRTIGALLYKHLA